MNQRPAMRRVERVRHELRRRAVTVRRVEAPSPGFASVTFGSDELADFVSLSFDDHVKFIFEDESGETVMRDYTPRRFDRDRRELTIEFALHGHGRADRWAAHARPGQHATLGGPRGSMIIPIDYDWHLLAGDSSALPAIRRRLEELPAGTLAMVRVQAAPVDRLPMATASALDLQWVDSAQDLHEAVRALVLPAGEGFAWCAGEAAATARMRRMLLDEKAHPREAMRVAAYWKPGAAHHHENLDD